MNPAPCHRASILIPVLLRPRMCNCWKRKSHVYASFLVAVRIDEKDQGITDTHIFCLAV